MKIMLAFVPVVVYCHQIYPINLGNVKGLKNIYKEKEKGYGDILASHFVLSFKESWQEGRHFPVHLLLSVTRNLTSYQRC